MKFAADFETTTNEEDCRVWAWGVCEIGNPDNFICGTTLETFMAFLEDMPNATFYWHNLKFDASFVIDWLLKNNYTHTTGKKDGGERTFKTLISDMGLFYSTKIIFKNKKGKKNTATFIDSLKIIPFKVAQVAKAFGLPEQKLELDYTTFREKNHILTNKEKEYLKHDVVIMAKALDVMFSEGLTKMTMASNALYDYKKIIGIDNFNHHFPALDPRDDNDMRQAYKGGYTFCQDRYKSKDIGAGIVLDVNSLYPWALRNCPLPYANAVFFNGEYKYDELYPLYIQMVNCRFELKEGYLPTIQAKGNSRFVQNEYLKSSKVIHRDKKSGWITEIDEPVTLCLSSIDLQLFKDHYNISNVTYLSGWKFKQATGFFTDYIDKWIDRKNEAAKTGNKGQRTISKLALNSLYGKFAASLTAASKIPYLEDGIVKYMNGEKEAKKGVYLPVGIFVTAHARNKTIRTAQTMYDKFVYADTDSCHILIDLPEELKALPTEQFEELTSEDLKKYGIDLGVDIDPYKLGAWKLEERFDRARYIRQKSYIHDLNGELKITCAGMPESCYKYVTWDNFREGASFKGKLIPKRVNGGTVLMETDFTILKS